MNSLQRHAQNAANRKEIRLIKSSSQKSREVQSQISSSIILTGNTYNESKITIDSTKFASKKKYQFSDITNLNNKSYRTSSGGAAILTTPQTFKNNYSNQISYDTFTIFDQTNGKISNKSNLNRKSSFNSRQTSSIISKNSHLNLSKGIVNNINDSQTISVNKDDLQIHQIKCDFNKLQKYVGKSLLEKNQNEQLENQTRNKISNCSNKLISQRDRNTIKLDNILSMNDNSRSNNLETKDYEKLSKHNRIIKSPLSYQNLINSLAKQTKIEQQLLEETIFLEKQIEDSHEQIKNLLSTSTNRDLSTDLLIKSSQNQSIKQIHSQISSIFNQNSQSNSLQRLEDKDQKYKTPKSKDMNKSQPHLQLKQNRNSQEALTKNCINNKISSFYKNFFHGNISQRSKKIRFQDNITKLHQFQEQLENNDLEANLPFSDNPIIESKNLSPNRLIHLSQQSNVKENKLKKVPMKDGNVSSIDQNSLNCSYKKNCVSRCSITSYFHPEMTPIPIKKQDTNMNQSFNQKLANEVFPLNIDIQQQIQTIKFFEKEDILNQLHENSSSNIMKDEQNNDNESIYSSNVLESIQKLEQQILQTPQIQKEKYNDLNEPIKSSQDIKSNKKLEIFNLLSRMNSKCQSTPSSKQNKSCNTFEKNTLNIQQVQINFNNSSKKISNRLFFEDVTERKQSPMNNKKKEVNSCSDINIKDQHIQETNNQSTNENTQSCLQQSNSINKKNTLSENLKILLSNQGIRNIMNKSTNKQNNTCRQANTNQQNASIKGLLKHIFNKSSQQNNI